MIREKAAERLYGETRRNCAAPAGEFRRAQGARSSKGTRALDILLGPHLGETWRGGSAVSAVRRPRAGTGRYQVYVFHVGKGVACAMSVV